jgi:hypothetical protein
MISNVIAINARELPIGSAGWRLSTPGGIVMSYISSSRMPHAYAEPVSNDQDRTAEAAKAVKDSIGGVSRGAWMIGALGVGAVSAVGAALYATLRPATPAPKKRRSAARKPAARSAKASA